MAISLVMLGDSRSVHIKRWTRALVDRGIKLTLISLGGEDIENVEQIQVPCRNNRQAGFLMQAGKVKRLINDIKPDLVHAHYVSSYGFWGAYSKYRPFCASVWGTDIVEFPNNWFKRKAIGRILKSADLITATSEYLKKIAGNIMPELNEKLAVVPFGVGLHNRSDKVKSDTIVRLIFLKIHHARYGPDILLKAFEMALRKNSKMSLTMAGDGPMTPQLKRMASELGMSAYIDFVGFIDYRITYDLLRKHDIMVMPSLKEGFGVSALEAGVARLPTIATHVGGIPEAVIDGKTGILVPPSDANALSDAIIKLAGNSYLRKNMGANAQQFVAENYEWNSCVDRMISIYQSLINCN